MTTVRFLAVFIACVFGRAAPYSSVNDSLQTVFLLGASLSTRQAADTQKYFGELPLSECLSQVARLGHFEARPHRPLLCLEKWNKRERGLADIPLCGPTTSPPFSAMDAPQQLAHDQTTPGDASTGVQPTIMLADLPGEIIAHVIGFVERPRDLLAARMASRVFDFVDVASRASVWALCPDNARATIMSRAPCDVVAQALPLYDQYAANHSDAESLIEAAAKGGRIEVMRLVHQHIAVPIPSLSRSFF